MRSACPSSRSRERRPEGRRGRPTARRSRPAARVAHRRSGPCRSARARSRQRAPTSPPTNAIQVATGGPPCSSFVPKSPGNSTCSTMPAASATGGSTGPRNAGEHRRAADEGECERDESGCASRLRQRYEIGEAREDERQQLEREHDDGAAEHERAPAASGRERSERHEHERCDGDRTRARDDAGRQVIARRASARRDRWRTASGPRASSTGPECATASRARSAGATRRRATRECRTTTRPTALRRTSTPAMSGACERKADERDPDEERVRRVHERDVERCRGERRTDLPRR